FFLATIVLQNQGVDLTDKLGLHFPGSEKFMPHQIITYMFMHGDFMHLFFNMFALWMFGNTLENVWGPKRFLIYYLITGIGAAICHYVVLYFVDLKPILDGLNSAPITSDQLIQYKENLLNAPLVVGASGSVFGILLAFGMLFPNTMLYVYFAIPIKAKWFVVIYGALELFSGLRGAPGDNVAHFAHLGGMLFGFILIKYWQKRSNRFY
ncbi:MAG: rhomboid family intramembrane serine protease, partial [Bacteroidota bacterium]|nr:rhomboid family intramembrane serine protease [Bacteroidota bacterium]